MEGKQTDVSVEVERNFLENPSQWAAVEAAGKTKEDE